MTQYIFILSLLLTIQVKGQQSCPIGYVDRKVMCDGQIVFKCIPENYSCNSCWIIVWPKCNGDERAADNYASSYDEAVRTANERQEYFKNSSCKTISTDYNRWNIYIRNNMYCNSIINNPALISDLKNKIIPFLNRYRAEISNYRRYFSGQPYKPGAVYKEYESVLKQAEQNANNLSIKLNTITDENLSQIESEFENIKNDETRLIHADTSYKNSISSSNTSSNDTSITSNTTSVTDAPFNNEITTEENFFNVQYNNATKYLEQLKISNSENAGNYENNFGVRLKQILSQFQTESSKGNQANVNLLKQYKTSLDVLIQDMDITQTNNINLKKQNQLNQNLTNENLNKALSNNQSPITSQMYLDQAKVKAIAGGNKVQLQQLEQIQQTQNQNSINAALTSVLNIVKEKNSSNNNPYLAESYQNYINALMANNINDKKIYETARLINSFFGILYQENISKQVSEIKEKRILDSMNRLAQDINAKVHLIDFDYKNINNVRYHYLLPHYLFKINTFNPSLNSNSELIEWCLYYLRSYLILKKIFVIGINFDNKSKASVQQNILTQYINSFNTNKGDKATLFLVEYYTNGKNTIAPRPEESIDKSKGITKDIIKEIAINDKYRPLIEKSKNDIYDCANSGCIDLPNKVLRYDSLFYDYINEYVGSNKLDSIKPDMEKALSLIDGYLGSNDVKNNEIADFQGKYLKIAIYSRFGRFNKDTVMLRKALNDCISVRDQLMLKKMQNNFSIVDKDANTSLNAIYLGCFSKEIEIQRGIYEINNSYTNNEVTSVLNKFQKFLKETDIDK
jgi:hypothetical protein